MSYYENQQRIKAMISTFPSTFKLRAWPGFIFRISEQASYVNDSGDLMLYTQKLCCNNLNEGHEHWIDFAKGTEAELRREIL